MILSAGITEVAVLCGLPILYKAQSKLQIRFIIVILMNTGSVIGCKVLQWIRDGQDLRVTKYFIYCKEKLVVNLRSGDGCTYEPYVYK